MADFSGQILRFIRSKKFIAAFLSILAVILLKESMAMPASKIVWWENDSGYSWKVGGVDVYSASAEELIALTHIRPAKKYGEVPDAKTAYEIAAKLLDDNFGGCSEAERPLQVYFNQKARSWIVRGTPNKEHPGCGVVAINRSTGEIFLLRHAI